MFRKNHILKHSFNFLIEIKSNPLCSMFHMKISDLQYTECRNSGGVPSLHTTLTLPSHYSHCLSPYSRVRYELCIPYIYTIV